MVEGRKGDASVRMCLRIGEVAKLLGVTPKAVRHYQKVGLLSEPPRSEARYRLYSAADLVRLLRIRRLQNLGLSLGQIKRVLGQPEQEQSLRQVLRTLLDDCAAQIAVLQTRRDRIQALLAEQVLPALDTPAEAPAILRWAREHLANHTGQVSPQMWEQDARIFGLLEGFNWPGDHQELLKEAFAAYSQHPQTFHLMLELGEQLASLAFVPADSPEVERLVEDVRRSGLAKLLKSLAPTQRGMEEPYGVIFADLMLSTLSPAQRRFLDIIRRDPQGN